MRDALKDNAGKAGHIHMKISVITVCYNSKKTIEQTIQSVFGQNYSNLEYIIIDGGSTDGTLDIIAKYQGSISLCVSEPDYGLYDAMNKGLARCRGDIVAFLNSDDWYEENTLARVCGYFENTDADIVSGNIFVHSADGKNIKMELDRKNSENAFFTAIYPQPALFVRKNIYEKLGGFDVSYKIAADTAWILNACAKGTKILCVEDYFTYFRDGGISCRKRYETVKEQYRAALACALSNDMVQIVKRVEEYYPALLDSIMNKQMFDNAMCNHILEVKKLFNDKKEFYIWGAGRRGKLCLDLFKRLGIWVSGFIDQNPEKKSVDGIPIVSVEEIGEESCICITPKGHEKDIREQLVKKGMRADSLLVYTDLVKQIAALGSFEGA